ncbi:hypothetical protein BDR04DRAFT_1117515 [Suillus decipiens]|nr:hypothetical protein BDR04DRAFT_1117515 [Suillus decipiens]
MGLNLMVVTIMILFSRMLINQIIRCAWWLGQEDIVLCFDLVALSTVDVLMVNHSEDDESTNHNQDEIEDNLDQDPDVAHLKGQQKVTREIWGKDPEALPRPQPKPRPKLQLMLKTKSMAKVKAKAVLTAIEHLQLYDDESDNAASAAPASFICHHGVNDNQDNTSDLHTSSSPILADNDSVPTIPSDNSSGSKPEVGMTGSWRELLIPDDYNEHDPEFSKSDFWISLPKLPMCEQYVADSDDDNGSACSLDIDLSEIEVNDRQPPELEHSLYPSSQGVSWNHSFYISLYII